MEMEKKEEDGVIYRREGGKETRAFLITASSIYI
jgi:DNA-binding MltR family transcriptional regulator